MKIYTKYVAMVTLGLLFCTLYTVRAQNKFSYLPEKPKMDDEITIIYNPANTNLKHEDKVEVMFSFYSHKSDKFWQIEETHSYPMKKNGDLWIAKIQTTSMSESVALKFWDGKDEEVYDNNNGEGYFIRFYDNNGIEKIGSLMGHAIGMMQWGAQLKYLNRDAKASQKIMDSIFSIYPEQRINYLEYYLTGLSKGTSEIMRVPVMKSTLEGFEKMKPLGENEYMTIIKFYTNLKMTEKADSIKRLALKEYPTGKIAKNEQKSILNAEKDLSKQKRLAIAMHKKFTQWEDYEPRPYAVVFANIIENGDEKMIRSWWNYIKDKDWTGLELYQSSLNKLVDKEKALDIAVKMGEIMQGLWKKERANPTRKKLNLFTEQKDQKYTLRDEALCYLPYAKALVLLNRKELAAEKYTKAFSICSLNEIEERHIEDYIKLMISQKKYETAKPVVENAMKSGILLNGMEAILKSAYNITNSSEKGFDNYYNNIVEQGRAKLADKHKKTMIRENAPIFNLTDLSGKTVSLADYKGKVVVVDFWATWCGPCKASFPAMQKAVNKYKDNENVVFLFINTWQKEADKKKNAEDFIRQTKYTFHVLLDNENKVVEAFKVSGIPTKFIIDGQGNIRFKVVGNETGDKAVESLSTMITLAG